MTDAMRPTSNNKDRQDGALPAQALVRSDVLLLPDDQGQVLRDGAEKESDPSAARGYAKGGGPFALYASFVRQAKQIPRLTEAQERALGYRVRDLGDAEAAKQLVLHNMRLAIKIARQYQRAWTNLMDLVQEASAGMAIASKRWDPDQGVRFGSYAIYWIKAQLIKFLMLNGRLIHTGHTRIGRKVYFKLAPIRKKLLSEGKEPSAEAIAKELGEDPKEVAQVLSRLNQQELSLSSPVDSEGSLTLESALPHAQESIENQVSRREIKDLINRMVAQFELRLENERDKAIWKEHLIAQEPKSLVELGKRYHVSKQRMGQLVIRLKRSFRRHVIDELGPDTQLSWLFNND